MCRTPPTCFGPNLLFPSSCDPFVVVSFLPPATCSSRSPFLPCAWILRLRLQCHVTVVSPGSSSSGPAPQVTSVEHRRRIRLGFRQAQLLLGFRQVRCLAPRQGSSSSASTR
ncbi:hypothetical protein ZWY2020_006351 [Hordeum vulgare]|nr:hypothetical protein ZWY2020_006351 [Hordeum vulgare]